MISAPLLVGLTVVAYGTSSPEMVVSVVASLNGEGDLAIGNVVGSNILNFALIPGLTAVIVPLKSQVCRGPGWKSFADRFCRTKRVVSEAGTFHNGWWFPAKAPAPDGHRPIARFL